MNKLTTSDLAYGVSGAIDLNSEETVRICGARCPDREAIACTLREAGVSVKEVSCLGTQGGCSSVNGELPEGSYATVMVQEVGSDNRERTVVAVTLDQDLPR